MRSLRAVVVAAAAAVGALLAFPLFIAVRAGDSKVIEPETFDYVLLGASVFAIALGLQFVWGTRRYIALLAVLASASLLFGFLAAFSIGLAFLPAGVVLLLLLYRALSRDGRNSAATRAALGGAATGFGLPLLYIALIVPPTVECFVNGGGTSGGRWHYPQAMSSFGSVGRDGVVTGRLEYANAVVTYRCENGRIVDFQRTTR